MPTNPYISQTGHRNEQNLLTDLNAEIIRMWGQDFFYIPRDTVHVDELLGEDIASNFKNAYPIEMYVENVEGYDGQDLFQKFGVEIRDEATVVVAKYRFLEELTSTPHSNLIRPREGDLLFLPFSNSLFEIMFVEHEQPFYILNNLPVDRMNISLFEYSNENVDVDIVGLDIPASDQTPGAGLEGESYLNRLVLASGGDWILGEDITQTISGVTVTGEIVKIENEGAILFVSHVRNDDGNYQIFTTGTVTGSVSGLSGTVSSVSQTMEDFAKNDVIETIADGIIDTSGPNNPLGEP